MNNENNWTCHRQDNHDPSKMNASQAKSLTTYYTHIDQIDPILTQHMTYSFADKSPGLTFHAWLFDTNQHEKPFQAFQNARKEINEAEHTAAAIATFITHSGIEKYTRIAAEPRKEALRFSNPERHKSFDDYVSRIKEICEEATDHVSDNQLVIAQALLDNDLHAYEQAIRNAVASNLRVTAVITSPTETIEQLEQTRPELCRT